LTISAGGSTVQGLAITHFNRAIHLTGNGNDVVAGNFLGTDPTGSFSESNSTGIAIDDTGQDLIGGTSPGARNLLSGNFSFGLFISLGSSAGAIALCWVIWPSGARGLRGRWNRRPDGPRAGRRRSTPKEFPACPVPHRPRS
jgi:hypothetical protein